MKLSPRIRTGGGLLLLLSATQLMAQGYYVDEQSALRLGDAFSGGAASASDAATAFYGPAAMLKLGDEIAVNLAVISVRSELDGSAGTLGGTPVSGKDAEADNLDLLPSVYLVHQLSEGLAMGAFINAPYATGTDFGDDSIARYQTTESEITGIDAGFSLAFQVHEQVSLGGSIIAQYVNARTAVAINTSAICLAAENAGDLGPYSCDALGIDSSELGSDTYDGQFEMEGHNTAFGFSAGTLIDLTPSSRIGLNYRTRIAHQLSGSAEVAFPAAASGFTSLAGLDNTSASGRVKLVTPENASLSYYQAFGAFALQADYSWTRWSRYDQVRVESDNAVVAALAAQPQTYNWTESHRFAVGASWQFSPQLTLRSGIALDKTPIRDNDTKVDFAFDDYQAISIGMSYRLQPQLTLDMGLQHTLTQQRDIDQNDLASAGAHLQGEVTTRVNSFAAGLRWAL